MGCPLSSNSAVDLALGLPDRDWSRAPGSDSESAQIHEHRKRESGVTTG
jgi:hypothetical protein